MRDQEWPKPVSCLRMNRRSSLQRRIRFSEMVRRDLNGSIRIRYLKAHRQEAELSDPLKWKVEPG